MSQECCVGSDNVEKTHCYTFVFSTWSYADSVAHFFEKSMGKIKVIDWPRTDSRLSTATQSVCCEPTTHRDLMKTHVKTSQSERIHLNHKR